VTVIYHPLYSIRTIYLRKIKCLPSAVQKLWRGSRNLKSRSRDHDHAPLPIFLVLAMAYLTKKKQSV